MIAYEDYVSNIAVESIQREKDYVDIKEYSHNIIMLNLQSLRDIYHFSPHQINKVIVDNQLDKKGWKKYLTD